MNEAEILAQWAESKGKEGQDCAAALRWMWEELLRLQAVLDSRPPINAALPQSYIEWSAGVYAMELRAPSEHMQ